ncbi:cellulose biosynthesis protein BcsC [Pseudoroseomonas cervicalis]|uniref:cellulose biosynthesis protein BcsC n=1 Tax=Teichococcus cervicalis TaxID=204525 RepID=UPI0022F178C7|nr:cellulose biosynthesis protein BcsC [Pseudoroseomonas cervicalis]WBV42583.1 cellulose synthase subunit BcsC-related outer membrane protein [Pseudoroseomonas cervicalis]
MPLRAALLATACSLALLPALGAAPARAQDAAYAVLLEQAEYWRAQGRPDRAALTLDRLLAAEPDHLGALAAAIAARAELGEVAAATRHLERLRLLAPADPRLQSAALALRGAQLDPQAVAAARRLAQGGAAEEAVARYQALFGGSTPPDAFALEYYEALAGTAEGQAEARDALEALAAARPQDARLALALARAMTYRPGSRAEGVRRLQALAAQPENAAPAMAAWRAALLWEPPSAAQIPGIEAYLAAAPQDAALRQRLAEARGAGAGHEAGARRLRGFALLNAGRLEAAAQDFEAVLAARPGDAEALGGLGLARLRQGRTAEARRSLAEAVARDPEAGRARWGRALEGASGDSQVAQARALAQRGAHDPAEALLRRALRREGAERAEAEALLAELLLRRGDWPGAELHFRAALERRPLLPTALAGLAEALQRQGRLAEAGSLAALRARLLEASAAQRAEALRLDSLRAGDAESAAGLLRAALAAEPGNPWLRLDLARALARQGLAAEIPALLPAGEGASPDTLQAAALLAADAGRSAEAALLLERIPARLRSAEAVRLARRVRLNLLLAEAAEPAAYGHAAEAARRLVALAGQPDPSGELAALVVQALSGAGQAVAAEQAAEAALAANAGAPASARLRLADALAEAGLDRAAGALAARLAQEGRLSLDERRQLALLRPGAESGPALARAEPRPRPAEAAPQPVAQRGTADAIPAAGPAMSDPRATQRLAEAVLRRDPRHVEARANAIEAALALGEGARAEALLEDGRALLPNDPRLSLLEARLARLQGDTVRARAALALAAEQRRGQIGAAPGGMTAQAAAGAPQRVALAGQGLSAPPAAYGAVPQTYAQQQYAQATYPPAAGQAGYALPLSAPPAAAEDPLLRQIDRELASVQDEAAPRLAASFNARGRSGEGGLDRMTEFGAGAEASAPLPGVGGRVTLRAQAVTLDAGDMSQNAATLSRFGSAAQSVPGNGSLTAAQARALSPSDSTASGVSLGLGYARDSFSADIGSTPLGFRKQNVLGGVEVAPSLGSNLRLRVTAERRAITDTLLSWSGMRDPSSGTTWGGVVRNTGRGQLEYGVGDTNFYAGGGYSTLEGDGVADNTRIEAYAGVSHALYRRPDAELVTGLDLLYQSYDKNLRYFTLGHGGYFSPQSFVAASVPLDYRARSGDFSYRIGASVGLASFREDRSPVFPNDSARQAQQEALAAANSGYTAFYAGQSQTVVTAGLRADLEYAVTPSLRLGAALRYDRSADWNEARGLLYARYRVDP